MIRQRATKQKSKKKREWMSHTDDVIWVEHAVLTARHTMVWPCGVPVLVDDKDIAFISPLENIVDVANDTFKRDRDHDDNQEVLLIQKRTQSRGYSKHA